VTSLACAGSPGAEFVVAVAAPSSRTVAVIDVAAALVPPLLAAVNAHSTSASTATVRPRVLVLGGPSALASLPGSAGGTPGTLSGSASTSASSSVTAAATPHGAACGSVDAVVVRTAPRSVSEFDQVMRRSDSWPRFESSLIAVGEAPCVGIYRHALEARASASAAAASVLSSVARSVFGWLGGAADAAPSTAPTVAAAVEPAEVRATVAAILRLRDAPRRVMRAALSPSRRYVLMADNVARVMVVDAEDLIVRRVWKGYRDAQCAWLAIPSAEGGAPLECVCLLAPRRGLLEIWHPAVPVRLWAVNVGLQCRLLAPLQALRADCARVYLVRLDGSMSEIVVDGSAVASTSHQQAKDGDALDAAMACVQSDPTDLVRCAVLRCVMLQCVVSCSFASCVVLLRVVLYCVPLHHESFRVVWCCASLCCVALCCVMSSQSPCDDTRELQNVAQGAPVFISSCSRSWFGRVMLCSSCETWFCRRRWSSS
jgi:hypothetical protein